MRLPAGVEWAVHALLNLSWAGGDHPVSTATLALGHDHPPAYLNKQLQRLVKAGLLTSEPGAQGGFRLARGLESITLLDVVDAIEGNDGLFRCMEIRQCGTIAASLCQADYSADYSADCAVMTAMGRAENAWRAALSAQTLAGIRAEADAHAPEVADAVRRAFSRR